MVTYSDLFEFTLVVITIVGLCCEIFIIKTNKPPLPPIVMTNPIKG